MCKGRCREERGHAAEFDLHRMELINIPRTLRTARASSFPLCLFDLLPHSFWVHGNNLLKEERQIQREIHSEQRDKVAWLMTEVRVKEGGYSDRSTEAETVFCSLQTIPYSSMTCTLSCEILLKTIQHYCCYGLLFIPSYIEFARIQRHKSFC